MKTKLFLLIAIVVLLLSGGWTGYAQKENLRWDYTVIPSQFCGHSTST
jgi:hypothetical protein